jgi:DNA polymerase (family X)
MQAELGDSLRLLHGVELNIGPHGELDYDLEFRRGFDWCLASVHDHFELDRAAQTNRVVTAMRDPAVRMIGHLSARMIGGRPPIELDIDAIAAAAEETGTALEVNGALPRLDLSVEALRHARSRDVTFLLTSDAHRAEELDRARFASLNAERAWVDPAKVANTWAPERLLKWIDEGRPTAT